VDFVLSKTGRAERGHADELTNTETYIALKPLDAWRRGVDKAALVDAALLVISGVPFSIIGLVTYLNSFVTRAGPSTRRCGSAVSYGCGRCS
jgi:Cu/Ag efflux pump CusA